MTGFMVNSTCWSCRSDSSQTLMQTAAVARCGHCEERGPSARDEDTAACRAFGIDYVNQADDPRRV
jgi:hypothetical protein